MSEVSTVAPPGDPSRRLPRPVFWIYEASMGALAVLVVWLLTVPDRGWVRVANLAIWAVFGVDYFTRLALATDRRQFVRRNLPDLVAILPLDFLRVARVARLARLVRLVRAGRVVWRVSAHFRGVLGTNGLGWVLLCTVVVVVGGGFAAWAAEPAFDRFPDALWWAVVTATTVGYGDLSPETPQARLIAVVLMLVGIGTLGMITGSIATYFVGHHQPNGNAQVDMIREQLAGWDDLAPLERRRLAAMLGALADLE